MARYQDGEKPLGGIAVIAQSTGAADKLERERLKLAAGDVVVRVTRIRSKGDQPMSHELAVLALEALSRSDPGW